MKNGARTRDRWNCKCGLKQTDKPATKTPESAKKDNPQPGLDNNPANDGKIFSDNNPHQKNAYPGAKKAVEQFLGNEVVDTRVKTVKTFKNGGIYSEYAGIDKNKSDYNLVRNIGIEFARIGKEAAATPQLHFKSEQYSQIYDSLLNTKYYRKCPDLRVDGKFYEIEGFIPPFSRTKIKNMLTHGVVQSNNLVLNNTKGASDRHIIKLIHQRIRLGQDINEVWLYEKGKIRNLYKKQ